MGYGALRTGQGNIFIGTGIGAGCSRKDLKQNGRSGPGEIPGPGEVIPKLQILGCPIENNDISGYRDNILFRISIKAATFLFRPIQ